MGLAAVADLTALRSNCPHYVVVSGFVFNDPLTRFQMRLNPLISFSQTQSLSSLDCLGNRDRSGD
jgi:hypothetical protein